MKWKGRRGSTNVEDARGRRVAAGAGGLGMILNLVGRTFGIKGILLLVVLGFIGWQMGLLDPAALMGGGRVQETAYQPSPEEQERFEFVRVVLADTEDVWAREFERIG
ncbi:MAG: neutral zinc metallopeptidase, partial [Candidatus Limnocylindrales bacterium]